MLVRGASARAAHVQIDVVDHGLGIPHDQIEPPVPEVRARAHGGSTPASPAPGLGLYICRLIVEGHSGRIWAESEPGLGSTFSVLLPLDPRKTRPAST